MSKQKLTPWFVNGEPPARPGVYQQMCGLGKKVGYQYWSGEKWGLWYEMASDAANRHAFEEDFFAYPHCGEKWRGLASDPGAKP